VRIVNRWRERRREVGLKLSREDVNLLGLILRNPKALPLGEYGMKEYHCGDENAVKKLMRLKKWLEEKVMGAKYEEGFEGNSTRIKSFDVKDSVDVTLKTSYREFLITVVEHYKQIGNSTTFSTSYWPLLWKLKEQNVADEDPSEDKPA
jgi:hypothetical protein